MRQFALASMAVLIGGCVFSNIESGLKTLEGRHESVAFDVLGYPSSRYEMGADVVYSWYVNSAGSMILPQTTTTYGTVGSVPFQGTTYGTQVVPYNYNCQIRVIAGRNGVIKSWDYQGNAGGCSAFSSRLGSYAERVNSRSSAKYEPSPHSTDVSPPNAAQETNKGVNQAFERPSLQGRFAKVSIEPFPLYKTPTDSAERIQALSKTKQLLVLEEAGEWVKVETSDNDHAWKVVKGWVRRSGIVGVD